MLVPFTLFLFASCLHSPVAFSRYLHSRTDNTIRTISVMDPSFYNVDAITDFLIRAQDLPPFMSFITSVAVEVNGVTGPYSGYSGETTYNLEGEEKVKGLL